MSKDATECRCNKWSSFRRCKSFSCTAFRGMDKIIFLLAQVQKHCQLISRKWTGCLRELNSMTLNRGLGMVSEKQENPLIGCFIFFILEIIKTFFYNVLSFNRYLVCSNNSNWKHLYKKSRRYFYWWS